MSTNPNAEFLLQKAREAGITAPRELANFMGQMQVESGGFHRMEESTHYSAERLLEVFGPHTDKKGNWHDGRNGLTTLDEARAIVRSGPEGIANAVYGGTWGARQLGNTEPDDGWRFRGRGYVQLTGRDHYEAMGKRLGVDLVAHPEMAADRDIAARIAIAYWNDRVRPNDHQTDVDAATHDINGGTNGLQARRDAAHAWRGRLEHANPEQAAPTAPVKHDAHAAAPAPHSSEAALVTSRDNPHHALFEHTLAKVREAEHARGVAPGAHSERIAAALTTELIREGITRVDRVEFNRDNTLVRAVQVSPMRDETGLNHATDAISSRQASLQSIAESSRQMHEAAVNMQARRQDPQFTQAQPHVAPSPALAH